MLTLAQGNYWLPPDVSVHGGRIDSMINFLHVFMVVLFVGWGIFFVYCLYRFRQRAGHKAQYQPVKAVLSKYAEIGVVIVETVLLVAFSIPIWRAYRIEPPAPEEDPMEIRVIAQQFAWNVHYSGKDREFGPRDPKLVDEQDNPIGLDRSHPASKDDVVTLNTMHAPANRAIVVNATSKDVIHSFWIPLLRIKQDTIPGMNVPLWFKATKTSAEMRESVSRPYELPDPGDEAAVSRFMTNSITRVVMDDYAASDGSTIVSKGGMLTQDTLSQLHGAGITAVAMAPRHPIEIHCAQLCGLEHYSMRGFFISETMEEFNQFLEESVEEEDEDDF